MASALEILTFANQLAVPVARAHLTTDQTITGINGGSVALMTQLTTNAVDFDPFGGFNTSTGTFTCPCAGLWVCYGQAKWATTGTASWIHLGIIHSGTTTAVGPDIPTSSSINVGTFAFDIVNAGAGDSIVLGANWGAVSSNLSTSSTDTTGRDCWLAVGLLART